MLAALYYAYLSSSLESVVGLIARPATRPAIPELARLVPANFGFQSFEAAPLTDSLTPLPPASLVECLLFGSSVSREIGTKYSAMWLLPEQEI